MLPWVGGLIYHDRKQETGYKKPNLLAPTKFFANIYWKGVATKHVSSEVYSFFGDFRSGGADLRLRIFRRISGFTQLVK